MSNNNVINVDFKNRRTEKTPKSEVPPSYDVKYLDLANIQFKSMGDLHSFMSKHFCSLSEKIAERAEAVPSFGYMNTEFFYVCISIERQNINPETYHSIRGMIASCSSAYNGRVLENYEDLV